MLTTTRRRGSSPIIIWDPDELGAVIEYVLRFVWDGGVYNCSTITTLHELLEERPLSIIIVLTPRTDNRIPQAAHFFLATRCTRQDGDRWSDMDLGRTLCPVMVVPLGRSISWPSDRLPFSCEVCSPEKLVSIIPDYDLTHILSELLSLEDRNAEEIIIIHPDTKFPTCCDTSCPGRQSLGMLRPAIQLLSTLANTKTLSEDTNPDIRSTVPRRIYLTLEKSIGLPP